MNSTVSTTVAAPIRTAAQLGAGAVLVEFYAAFWGGDWSNRQYLAAVALVTLVVTACQHLVENRLGKAILRRVPPRTAPVVDERGAVPVTTVIVLFLLFVILLILLGVISV